MGAAVVSRVNAAPVLEFAGHAHKLKALTLS